MLLGGGGRGAFLFSCFLRIVVSLSQNLGEHSNESECPRHSCAFIYKSLWICIRRCIALANPQENRMPATCLLPLCQCWMLSSRFSGLVPALTYSRLAKWRQKSQIISMNNWNGGGNSYHILGKLPHCITVLWLPLLRRHKPGMFLTMLPKLLFYIP